MLDLEMPRMDGIETLQRLGERGSNVRVIVFTVLIRTSALYRQCGLAQRAICSKARPETMCFAPCAWLNEGGSLLEPLIASKLLDSVNNPDALTARQKEVLHLLATGLLNKEIADQLHISERTVKFHVSEILGKLGAGNRTEAAAIAMQRGLI